MQQTQQQELAAADAAALEGVAYGDPEEAKKKKAVRKVKTSAAV